MDLNIKRIGTRSVVYVEGDIDLYSSPELRETVLDLFRKRQQEQIIVNLAEVSYIDSSGKARKQNRRFVLVGLREGPRHVLELTRLLNVFEIAETEEAVT